MSLTFITLKTLGLVFKDDDGEDDENLDTSDCEGDDMVQFDGDYVTGANLSEAENDLVNRFLKADRSETRTLADIIMEKIREKEMVADEVEEQTTLPPKVVEVYTAVGRMLRHYKSGKLPKALKMLPHLRNWEEVLWITRPGK